MERLPNNSKFQLVKGGLDTIQFTSHLLLSPQKNPFELCTCILCKTSIFVHVFYLCLDFCMSFYSLTRFPVSVLTQAFSQAAV